MAMISSAKEQSEDHLQLGVEYKLLIYSTWFASAKLAVIFPGISFVAWLVQCNHLRLSVYGSSARRWQAVEHQKEVPLPLCFDVLGFYHELSR